jgi:hypothetical protein
MRNMLAFLGAALVVFLGLGWYLDWYRIQSTPQGGGQHRINIDLNTKKIGEDVNKGLSKGEQKLQEVLKNEPGHQPGALQQEAESSPRDESALPSTGTKKEQPVELKFTWPPRPVPSTGVEKK